MPLAARWRRLWANAGCVGDPGPAYADLVARYAEPHRAYHTLAHIEQCLDAFEACDEPLSAAAAVAIEFALWFHDAVYDTRAGDNEARSAELAARVLAAAGSAPAIVARVDACIRVTAHDREPQAADEALMLDVDLSILGQPPALFDAYERQVREEYAWVPEADFRAGREAILRRFLDRPHIYATQWYRNHLEAQARENLSRSTAALAGP